MRKFSILLTFFVIFLAQSCSNSTYTVYFINEKSKQVIPVTAFSSRPVQLLNATAFISNDASQSRIMMWSTNKSQSERSDAEISSPELKKSKDDLNFKPSSIYTDRKSIKLYAIWTTGRSKVIFDSNGGTFTTGANSEKIIEKEKIYGVDYTIPSNSDLGLKGPSGNSTFLGWSKTREATNLNASGTDSYDVDKLYLEGDTYSDDGVVTFYAVWGVGHYNIKYILNEDSVQRRVNARGDGGTTVAKAKLAQGQKKISFIMEGDTNGVKLNSEPTLEGCRFICWSKEPDMDPDHLDYNKIYAANARFRESSSDTTLYAIWKENEYKITFYPNPAKSPYNSPLDNRTAQEKQNKTDVWVYGGEGTYDYSSYAVNFPAEYTDKNETAQVAVVQTKYYYSPLDISKTRQYAGDWKYSYKQGKQADTGKYSNFGIDILHLPKSQGYIFKGWRASDSKVYDPVCIITENRDMNLYGEWEEKKISYTIKYNAGVLAMAIADSLNTKKYTEGFETKYEYNFWDLNRKDSNGLGVTKFQIKQNDTVKSIEDLVPSWGVIGGTSYCSFSSKDDSTQALDSEMTEINVNDFKKMKEDDYFSETEVEDGKQNIGLVYEANIYPHWGKPIVGKVVQFNGVKWIIVAVDEKNKKMKLFYNQCSDMRYFASNLTSCSNLDCSNHLHKQRWDACNLRTYINNGFRNQLPADVRALNLLTTITTGGHYPSTTNDYLWVPSSSEMVELGNLFNTNADFKNNVFKASWQWQRDTNSTQSANAFLIEENYYYCGCAVTANGVVYNLESRHGNSNTYSPMGWFRYDNAN